MKRYVWGRPGSLARPTNGSATSLAGWTASYLANSHEKFNEAYMAAKLARESVERET